MKLNLDFRTSVPHWTVYLPGFVTVCILKENALKFPKEAGGWRKAAVSVKPKVEKDMYGWQSVWGRVPGRSLCRLAQSTLHMTMRDFQAGITSQASARVSCLDQAGDTS